MNFAERTVNCALDINRMISYILYLSLPWSYEVGSCNIDTVKRMMSYIQYLSLQWSYEVESCTIKISVMTAIKQYLYCYRLDFNQKSLNYTVANAHSTLPNAQSTVHWTLLTEWYLTSYISVYDGRMKLGVEPLRSVWWQLSNDIYFVID